MRWFWLFLCFTLPSHATQITFEWIAQPDYPVGVTYELQANGVTASGITGTSYTLTVPDGPGQPLTAQVRAKAAGYNDSPWATFSGYVPGATVPNAVINLSATNVKGTALMPNPVWQENGTQYESGANSVSSGQTTIANVSTGDLVIVRVGRVAMAQITGVSGNGAGLTSFTLLKGPANEVGNWGISLYGAIATSSAASVVITASFSNSNTYLSTGSSRYSNGSSLVSLTPLASGWAYGTSGTALHATSTDREYDSVTVGTGKTALLLAIGADYDNYNNAYTGANGWSVAKAPSASSSIFSLDRVVSAGTYGGTGTSNRIATVTPTDRYQGVIVALEISSGATSLAPFQLSSPIFQAVNSAQW